MKKLFTIVFLLSCLSAQAINKVAVSITITNLPLTGNAIGFTAPAVKVIVWSNVTTADYVATNTTVNGCATNLFLQLAAFSPWNPRPALAWVNTNQFTVTADCGSILTATNLGAWVTLTYDTNTCASMRAVQVPMASYPFSTTRVEVASQVLTGINDYATNSFGTNITAFTNYLSLGAHPQWVRGVKYGTWAGTNAGLTNGPIVGALGSNFIHLHGSNLNWSHGYTTNIRADKMISTSLVNYANAISSPGTNGTGSEQFGTSAIANQDAALAVGNSAAATNTYATAIGNTATAGGSASTAIGRQAFALGANAIAIGPSCLSYTNNIAIGSGAEATHINAIVIGTATTSTADNTATFGTTTHLVRLPGIVQAGSVTNFLVTGTNVNRGDWADEEFTLSSLANGNNVAVPGTNVFIRLAAGPTAAFTICGISGGRSGRVVEMWNDTGQALTIAHQSGVDPTAANRIITSGADVVFGTNVYVTFRYSAARARWKLSGSRE